MQGLISLCLCIWLQDLLHPLSQSSSWFSNEMLFSIYGINRCEEQCGNLEKKSLSVVFSSALIDL